MEKHKKNSDYTLVIMFHTEEDYLILFSHVVAAHTDISHDYGSDHVEH